MSKKQKMSRRTVTPKGINDGNNRLFTIALPSFREGSEMVFRDGILMEAGEGNDYVAEYSPQTQTLSIKFEIAPETIWATKILVNVEFPSQVELSNSEILSAIQNQRNETLERLNELKEAGVNHLADKMKTSKRPDVSLPGQIHPEESSKRNEQTIENLYSQLSEFLQKYLGNTQSASIHFYLSGSRLNMKTQTGQEPCENESQFYQLL